MQRNTGTGIALHSVPVLCFRGREAHNKRWLSPISLFRSPISWKTALRGGKHAKLIDNYTGRSVKEISKAIRSHEKQAALHKAKLLDPDSFYPEFRTHSIDRQKREINDWVRTVIRHEEEADILKEILRNK